MQFAALHYILSRAHIVTSNLRAKRQDALLLPGAPILEVETARVLLEGFNRFDLQTSFLVFSLIPFVRFHHGVPAKR